MSGSRSRRLALFAALATCPAYACQAFISTDSYFNADGVTYLAQYSELDPPPSQLTLTPAGLFFVESDSIWVVATAGTAPPALVKTFSAPPTSLQFDGVDTIFACDPTGAVFAASATTLVAVAAPTLSAACLSVAASAEVIATAAIGDAGAGADDPDGSVPLTLAVVNRVNGSSAQLPEHSLTTFDVTVASTGFETYATALGLVRRFSAPSEPGAPPTCALAFIGETPRPKILVLPSVEGGPLLLVRGRSDLVHTLEPDAACCDTAECLTTRVTTSVQPGPGDLAAAAPYVYWSDQNTVKRQRLADINAGVNATVVLTIGSSTSLISELAADDQAVYVVVGSELLRAPLPASPGS